MAAHPYFLTDKHYMLFGRIVADYARAEMGLRFLIADMTHLPGEVALVLTSPYTSAHLRNVTKSIAKIVMHDDRPLLDRLLAIVGGHQSLSQIRNDIGHNLWRDAGGGDIIPMYTDVREGKFQFKGVRLEDRRYSVGDLEKLVAKSASLTIEMLTFLDSQAFADCMARNADLKSLDIDSILGTS